MRIGTLLIAFFGLTGLALAQTAPDSYYDQLVAGLPEGEIETLEGWEAGMRASLDALSEQDEGIDTGAAQAEILALLDAERLPLAEDETLVGDWRVRSLQISTLGAFAYQYFPARIHHEARALVFDKASGSQRHQGLMARARGDHYLFVGAMYYSNEPKRLHSAHMAEGADADPAFDTLAEIYKLGEDHYLMAFAPQREGPRYRLYEMRR